MMEDPVEKRAEEPFDVKYATSLCVTAELRIIPSRADVENLSTALRAAITEIKWLREGAEQAADALLRERRERGDDLRTIAAALDHVPVIQRPDGTTSTGADAVAHAVGLLQGQAAALQAGGKALLESLGEYVRQSMHFNREWRSGIVAIEAALSPTAGAGWRSPKEVAEMERKAAGLRKELATVLDILRRCHPGPLPPPHAKNTADAIDDALQSNDAGRALVEERGRLREALECANEALGNVAILHPELNLLPVINRADRALVTP